MTTKTVARAAPRSARESQEQYFGIAVAILVALSVLALPTAAGLSAEGKRTAAILLAALALWATEAIPVAVTALLALILQPIFGVGDLQTAFRSFISPVFFFVLVMFFIAQAFVTTGLARRYALWLLARAGTDARRVVFAFVMGTGLLSTVISDVPCCAIFMTIAVGIFEKLGLAPGRSRFAKSLMIGIPMASMIGGVGTPAGSSVNVLGLHFIEQYGKVRVPFLSWVAIGIPMVLVLIPLCAWALTRFYPPEMKTIGEMEEIQAERASLGPMTAREWKVVSIMCAMIALWILGAWVRRLDLALVGMAGGIAMFLPGMNLLSWKEVERATGWEVLLMIGGVTSLGAASVRTGLAKWLVDASIGGVEGWNVIWIIALISAFTVVIHLLLPIAPVINAVLIPPIVLFAVSTGQNPALYSLPVVFTASCAFLLPLDPVALITYGKGYYRMFDMFLPGAVVSVCWVVLMTALMVLLGPLLGLM